MGHGFPAPAGMDLAVTGSVHFANRIPRTRGDGPPASEDESTVKKDSPHPRGWTG